MADSKDPFLSMINQTKDSKIKACKDALLFGKSEAHTDSGRRFVKSCKAWFDEKGFLTEKQIAGLYKVDSAPEYRGEHDDDDYDSYADLDFDPFDP